MFYLHISIFFVFQRVLVSLGRHNDALVVAERGRTRAFVDLLLERQNIDGAVLSDNTPVTAENIIETVTKQKAAVLYFSNAAGFLYSWFISPEKGRF